MANCSNFVKGPYKSTGKAENSKKWINNYKTAKIRFTKTTPATVD